MVARGWSKAETPGGIYNNGPHPEGMREQLDLIIQSLASLQDAKPFSSFPGVSASLQPLAIIPNPFGVDDPDSSYHILRFGQENNKSG
jgi:hypothetical protein